MGPIPILHHVLDNEEIAQVPDDPLQTIDCCFPNNREVQHEGTQKPYFLPKEGGTEHPRGYPGQSLDP